MVTAGARAMVAQEQRFSNNWISADEVSTAETCLPASACMASEKSAGRRMMFEVAVASEHHWFEMGLTVVDAGRRASPGRRDALFAMMLQACKLTSGVPLPLIARQERLRRFGAGTIEPTDDHRRRYAHNVVVANCAISVHNERDNASVRRFRIDAALAGGYVVSSGERTTRCRQTANDRHSGMV